MGLTQNGAEYLTVSSASVQGDLGPPGLPGPPGPQGLDGRKGRLDGHQANKTSVTVAKQRSDC